MCSELLCLEKKCVDLSRVWSREPWISRRARYSETKFFILALALNTFFILKEWSGIEVIKEITATWNWTSDFRRKRDSERITWSYDSWNDHAAFHNTIMYDCEIPCFQFSLTMKAFKLLNVITMEAQHLSQCCQICTVYVYGNTPKLFE